MSLAWGVEGHAPQGKHLVLGDADEDVAVFGVHQDVRHRGLMPLQQPHRLFRDEGAPQADVGVIATSHWNEKKNEHQPLGLVLGPFPGTRYQLPGLADGRALLPINSPLPTHAKHSLCHHTTPRTHE